jgi:hypothetical protein
VAKAWATAGKGGNKRIHSDTGAYPNGFSSTCSSRTSTSINARLVGPMARTKELGSDPPATTTTDVCTARQSSARSGSAPATAVGTDRSLWRCDSITRQILISP